MGVSGIQNTSVSYHELRARHHELIPDGALGGRVLDVTLDGLPHASEHLHELLLGHGVGQLLHGLGYDPDTSDCLVSINY